MVTQQFHRVKKKIFMFAQNHTEGYQDTQVRQSKQRDSFQNFYRILLIKPKSRKHHSHRLIITITGSSDAYPQELNVKPGHDYILEISHHSHHSFDRFCNSVFVYHKHFTFFITTYFKSRFEFPNSQPLEETCKCNRSSQQKSVVNIWIIRMTSLEETKRKTGYYVV